MWLKIYDTTKIPAVEIVLDENFLLTCDYRRGMDGKAIIGAQRAFLASNTGGSLESKVGGVWDVPDVQIDLYSGDMLLKSTRACPMNFYIQDKGAGGYVVERIDFLVGGKVSSNGAVSGGTTPVVENSPNVSSATYSKSNGKIVINTDHCLHGPIGEFTVLDFDITKISIVGVTLALNDTSIDLSLTAHEHVNLTISGATKTAVDAIVDTIGSKASNGTDYILICNNGWNHPVSQTQQCVITVS